VPVYFRWKVFGTKPQPAAETNGSI